MDVREQIIAAFADTPRPANDRISADTYDDEETAEYFRDRSWQGHTAETLRYYCASLSFFTPEAFRYFLPAYMLAELDDPKEADIIADSIAYKFQRFAAEKSPPFNVQELLAILAFFHECARRYADGVADREYNRAAKKIESWLAALA